MSPEAHVSAFSDMGAAPLACRLLLAGTANTHSRDVAGQPWNEAVVANQCGVPLWHQQKLWPSEITPERAAEFGITGVGGAGNFHEDVASGSQIEVVDIDSLGRCVILICQDITSSDLATTLITDVQPDWVFVPIMDRGFAEKSWFSDIGQTVCTYSQARLVGICSTALPRAGTDKPHCLQIFCAERGEKYAPWRAVSLLAADGEPGAAIHHFGVTKWMRFDTVLKEAD
ncbi:hypothetical protein CYJ10_22000 [Cupriavidus pauculus]|uniref:CN hydrolase domain-containing protein n=2 Tax=Cupriavidus pauculus TaxID=82633 RepID=A0A2N5C8L8_9BURK|nr:hypothetical protein CYJ10_22000 [Cupriavidus pauculus]